MSTTTPTTAELHEAADRYVLSPMLRKKRVVYKKAQGSRLWDTDGKEYLDAVSGTNGVALVGHAHPYVIEAVTKQFQELPSHFLNQASPPLIEFAERISANAPTGPCKVYLCPGGGEAIESAVKLAMAITGKSEVVSLHGAYHGAGFASMSLAGISALRSWFPGGMRWPAFQQAPSPDPYRPTVGTTDDWRPAARGLEATLDAGTYGRVAAVLLELVQGPNGHVEFPPAYVQEVRRICTARGVLMIVDEVQTGLSRTGTLWACERYGVTPDIVVMGKAGGGGYPFGGVMVRQDLITRDLEETAWHILTFQNQPLQAAAGNAVLDIIENEGLVARAEAVGQHARGRFNEMAERYQAIGDVRGPGLFIAVDLVEDRETKAPATAECAEAMDRGFEIGLLTYFGGPGNALKFKPPVTTSDEDIDLMLDRCEELISLVDDKVKSGTVGETPTTPPLGVA